MLVGGHAGQRLDAPHAGGDGAFADDAEKPEFARGARVRSAAEFHRVAVERVRVPADLDDADDVAVFVAEELNDARVRLRLLMGNFRPGNAAVGENELVDFPLDFGNLLRRERGGIEVEGQLFVGNEGAFLRDVFPDDAVQREVQQVRRGVVAFDRAAALFVDGDGSFGADGRRLAAFDEMQEDVPAFARVEDFPSAAARGERSRVADLPAHLGVAGRAVEHDGELALAVDDFEHRRFGGKRFVAEEKGRLLRADFGKRDDLLFLGGAGAFPLLRHQRGESFFVR